MRLLSDCGRATRARFAFFRQPRGFLLVRVCFPEPQVDSRSSVIDAGHAALYDRLIAGEHFGVIALELNHID